MSDYGSAWRILRLTSLTDQIFIKAQRIRSLQTKKENKIDEGQESEFIGIINYSVMALIQIEKGISDDADMNINQAIKCYENQVKIVKNLMLDKNHDYGEAWKEMRVSSLTDLIIQKLLLVILNIVILTRKKTLFKIYQWLEHILYLRTLKK